METTGVNEITSTPRNTVDRVKSSATEIANDVKTNLDERANRLSQAAADKMHQAASSLRERGTAGEGRMNRLASSAAERIDSAATYVEGRSLTAFAGDLGEFVKRHPLQALACGIGFGFFAARLARRR